jgi:hypothetical protein
MRGKLKVALILASLPQLWVGTALGGEGIQVKITNDGTQDILVTVYDMNADAASPKCGHDDTSGVANDAAVNVHADSSCSV